MRRRRWRLLDENGDLTGWRLGLVALVLLLVILFVLPSECVGSECP